MAGGQNPVLMKEKRLPPGQCSIILDSLYVLPSSIIVKDLISGQWIPVHHYMLLFNTSEFIIDDSLCYDNRSFLIFFKTINFPVGYSLQRRSISVRQEESDTIVLPDLNEFVYYQPHQPDGLTKHGAIGRGISAGNNRGASLQSSLDIRLSGKLNNDVDIVAVITDNNIPIQPEGNTQQLREFDKVFVELSKNKSGFRVGDIDLNKPEGYFMNYLKKIQGGKLYTSSVSDKSIFSSDSSSHTMSFAGGISKGKFARNTFAGINGNQGPYRLTGAENEPFIVILAGTERVFINGEQLTRGQHYDYVIDYNTAELSFTVNRLISSDMRINIEFEYSDKNYVRSLFSGDYSYYDPKTSMRFNFYSEQDARNQPLQQNLDENDQFILQNAGDNPLAAVVPGWDSLGFSQEFILYAMIDTLGYDSVFIFSTDPNVAVYKVSFSFVGQGKGNYVLDKNIANGRVFKWVNPVAGNLQGDHEPYIALIAPKKQQMFTAGMDYKLSGNLITGFEFAVSRQDLNTFSGIDNEDNTGTAFRVYIRQNPRQKSEETKSLFSTQKELAYEFVEARFSQIDRFRPVEFQRDWNIQANEATANEHIVSGQVSLIRKNIPILVYKSDYFLKTGIFSGFKNQLNLSLQKNVFRLNNNLMYMISEKKGFNSSFFRQKGSFSAIIGKIQAGSAFEQEMNLFYVGRDSLFGASYHFLELEPFVTSASDSLKIQYRAWYKRRYSENSPSGTLEKTMLSQESGIKAQTRFSSPNQLSITAVYRVADMYETVSAPGGTDKTLLARFENSLSLWRGAVTSFLYYETGSGMEARKEFSYLEVSPGQGQFMWIDYNGNNIKELDEFEPAIYQDQGNYIKIMIPSNEYIRAYTLQINETFSIEPAKAWKNDTSSVKRLLSRFSDRLQFSLNKKTSSDRDVERFLPLLQESADTTLIFVNSMFSNTLFFNRAHPVFNARYRFSDNINKIMQINGFELRRLRLHEWHFVWNFSRTTGIETVFRSGRKTNDSEISFQRRYDISYLEFMPALNFQASVKQRLSMTGRYRFSENTHSTGNERSELMSVGPEYRFPVKNEHTFNVRFTYVRIAYSGADNSPIAYEMLESLEPGSNFTWNMSMQYIVSKALQLSFIYEGRAPLGKKVIHFGSIQLKALL
jgi:hypothetical protein